MAEVVLIRIDFRVIHGQVVTRWIKQTGATRIVVANDELAADDFMADVYRMSAPAGIQVDVWSLADAAGRMASEDFGPGKVLLIVKTAADALRLQGLGFPMPQLQAGNLGGGPGRASTASGVTFSAEDVANLRAIAAAGTEVYVQMLPNNAREPLERAIAGLGI